MPSKSLQPSLTPTGGAARRRIISAARHHFFAHGFRGVTMDDLAQELGMSKKTLYACFPGKAALVEAVLLDKTDRVEGDLAPLVAKASRDFPAALHDLLACMQHHLEEIRPPFLRDLKREMPEVFGVVERRRREVIRRHFGKLLGEGRKAGMIRKDIRLDLMIEILLGAAEAIMNPPKLADLGLTPKAGYSAIISVYLQGVLTQKGRMRQ